MRTVQKETTCMQGTDEKIQMGLRIPRSLHEELEEMADGAGMSVSAVIFSLIKIGLAVANE